MAMAILIMVTVTDIPIIPITATITATVTATVTEAVTITAVETTTTVISHPITDRAGPLNRTGWLQPVMPLLRTHVA